MSNAKVNDLASKLLAYKAAYYHGNELVPDPVYDALEDELKALAPDHSVLSMVGFASSGRVRHDPLMLSMQKTYDVSDVVSFASKHPLIMTAKADGSSLALEFAVTEDTAVLFRGSSRGNGEFGEDYTKNLAETKIVKRVKVSNALLDLGVRTMEVRGEMIFPRAAFERYITANPEEFKSIRNSVAGLLARKDPRENGSTAIEELKFLAYDLICRDASGALVQPFALYADLLLALLKMGFDVLPPTSIPSGVDEARLSAIIEDFYVSDEGRDFLVDGIIFRIDDNAEWRSKGATSHHPLGSMAFKRQGESAETTIESIEVATGRTGKVSFTAVLKPVELSGASLSRATLHNITFIEDGGYGPGAVIEIVRSGEVIPYVKSLVSRGQSYSPPETCSCGQPLARRGVDLVCDSSSCPPKELAFAEYFLKTLEVKGIAEATIEALYASGLVRSVGDFFRLTPNDFMTLEGVKTKSANNYFEAIQKCRSIGLDKFLSLLGIPGVGKTKGKELGRLFKTKEKVLSLSKDEILGINGWAEKTAEAFLSGIKSKEALIRDLLSVMDVKDLADENSSGGEGSLSGKTLVITGKLSRPRKDLKKLLSDAGAKISDSVSKDTSWLVCDGPSSSSKYKKAESLGIPLITEEEIVKLAGSYLEPVAKLT